jgi:hypothetical protein
MNLTARSVALPFATLGPDANTSVQRRPVYEYAQIRARKAFWVRCSVQVANSLVTRAMFYELIQQKPRQPPLVMSNYSTMIQEVASDVPKSHAVQLIKRRINRFRALCTISPQQPRWNARTVNHYKIEEIFTRVLVNCTDMIGH